MKDMFVGVEKEKEHFFIQTEQSMMENGRQEFGVDMEHTIT